MKRTHQGQEAKHLRERKGEEKGVAGVGEEQREGSVRVVGVRGGQREKSVRIVRVRGDNGRIEIEGVSGREDIDTRGHD